MNLFGSNIIVVFTIIYLFFYDLVHDEFLVIFIIREWIVIKTFPGDKKQFT